MISPHIFAILLYIFIISALLVNINYTKDCKNKNSLEILQYFNFTSAILLFFFVGFLRSLLSHSSAWIQRIALEDTKSAFGSSFPLIAKLQSILVSSTIILILLCLNGANATFCDGQGWEWLEKVNYIFVGIFGLFLLIIISHLMRTLLRKKGSSAKSLKQKLEFQFHIL